MPIKGVLINLQLCRALAAVLVVAGHALHDSDTIAARAGIEALHSTINWGSGVDIFFVISGFIMVHVAADDFAKPQSPWRFMCRRLARIVSLYWLTTSALILGAWMAPGLLNASIGGAKHIAFSYLFIPYWRPDIAEMRPILALGWTLNYEMLFYVSFAFAMFLPFSRAIAVLTLVFVGAVVARPLLHIEQSQIVFWTSPIILEFLLGAYIGIAYRAGWRLRGAVALAVAALGLAIVINVLPVFDRWPDDLNIISKGVPAALFVGAVILGPGLPTNQLTLFGKSVGDASYALYLTHPFVVRPLREVWLRLGGQNAPLIVYCVMCVIGATVTALMLHKYLEQPLTRKTATFLRTGQFERQPLA